MFFSFLFNGIKRFKYQDIICLSKPHGNSMQHRKKPCISTARLTFLLTSFFVNVNSRDAGNGFDTVCIYPYS